VTWDVVIAGGGFGGFYAARALERQLPAQSARVTLVNDANFMLYTPLLSGAAGATLDPRHVVVPLRSQLRRTELVIGQVNGADPQNKTLSVKRVDGEAVELSYDRLLVALGSVSRTLAIPGLAEHGIGFKSLSDATGLRNQMLHHMDIAESLRDEQQMRERLGFVFVGAGYAGVEGLAELQDFAAQAIELYPRCRTQGMRWVLVEAKDRIMEEVPDSLARFAADELRGRGIELRTGVTVQEIGAGSVELADGEVIPARTVVWTAGVKPSPAVAGLGLPLDGAGRIKADKMLRVESHDDVWAIGDCAAVPDPARPGKSCPPTAQHAIRQGRLAGANIHATLGGGRQRPFRYKTEGAFAELGSRQAVAITLGIRWRGFPAWLLARTYHLLMMPGIARKLRLLIDWNVALLFGRDVSAPGRLSSPLAPDEHKME
jgi:NADH dehydrogenase